MLKTSELWPELPLAAWQDTYATLHMWTQIVGKIRTVQSAWINHSWHVTLYVSARGLSTSPIPHGTRTFEIEFDFIAHQLNITTNDGETRRMPLSPMSVAEFYQQVMALLDDLNLPVTIPTMPNEVADAVRFEDDQAHASYDPDYANRFWRILTQSDRVFKQFRSSFIGKCSPVQFFWGSFDLAVTRFSGRVAPLHPGGVPHLSDRIAQEAYSQEVSSCGFWPGGGPLPMPVFYSYSYPEPEDFNTAVIRPDAALYNVDLKEFVLPYDAVRTAANPDQALLGFLDSTYEAAATNGKWNRYALERRRTKA